MNNELKLLYTLLLSNSYEIDKITQEISSDGCITIRTRGYRTFHTPGFWPQGANKPMESVRAPTRETIVLIPNKTRTKDV